MFIKLTVISALLSSLNGLAFSERIPLTPDRVALHPRATTCTPTAGGSSTADDVPAIQSAIKSCASGTILIPAGQTYHINSQLSFAGCTGCTLQLDGVLSVSTDFDYWNGKSQVISLSKITGATITGSGTINGNGQASWDHIITATGYVRPKLIRVEGCNNIHFSGFTLKDAPMFHIVTNGNSKDITYSDLTLHSVSTSANVAHNTDGFDIGPASNVRVLNSQVTNDDDCVVLKPGADQVHVEGVTCTGSHGLSVGSLAGTSGANDVVTNSIFKNCTVASSDKAAGIKVFDSSSGHGSASVSNVTWQDIICDKCDYAFRVLTCYQSTTTADCTAHPAVANMQDIVLDGFTGTTSGHYKNNVANINCSPSGTCGITVKRFSVTAPSGANTVLCANTPSNLGLTCTSGASG
ncbi:endo-xylogalacturonan hydrolase A like protein [Verticillium longisporum]|uniref:Endo-xylogalacturonan hydrolase A like protein n=1 Tax=Verticillium longisporum TaxID=100787 RepID=A0A0G4MZM0_VERLO|nr:endo-xylogalacturonan hydrolase A like protein [Verticillium longisporum]KAG7127674.1 endo-xylogalacturonan hydrolase A like protein [Verticillium longisporum]CRK14645.1 hypothetical protein BN1723_010426 [Verticillium longisporum]CRK39622.1 hypothetical protein BN1708_016733 [Verticillium longisporum]